MNCGERYQDMIDHHSYTQLKYFRKQRLKKFKLEWDSNPWPLQYRYSPLPTEELMGMLQTGNVTRS